MTKLNPYIMMKLERARELVSSKDYAQAQQEVQEGLEESSDNPDLMTLLSPSGSTDRCYPGYRPAPADW
jgi:uncharacterized protein HemY